MSSLTLDGADARLGVRLREEEQNGSIFAFRGRLVALGLVALWLMFAAGPMRVGVGVGACVAMMASAWLVYATRASRFAPPIQIVVTLLDVTVAWFFTRPLVGVLSRRKRFTATSFIGAHATADPAGGATA